MSSKYIERVTHIENLLLIQNLVIDTTALREACMFGVPDLLRPLCWRLFLCYLPKERQEWPSMLDKQRNDYKLLAENVLSTKMMANMDQPLMSDEHNNPNEADDHPLSSGPRSEWARYFKDNEVLIQIDKDVRRLRPEIDFFQRTTSYPFENHLGLNLAKRIYSDNNELNDMLKEMDSKHGGSEFHWQVVERILFVYSKVNPGIKYVQGMNELIGPIYYVFASDPDREWARYAEADTFYCFQHLMSDVKDNFIKSLDNSNCGIESTLSHFYYKFELLDAELYGKVVEKLEIKAQFYAFRWLSLLLSQEFSLPDLINIWDTVFASRDKMEMTEYICLAMLENVRQELLSGDFSHNVRLLQNYPVVDVSQLVTRALELPCSERPRTGSDSSQKSSGRFWNRERFSAMVSGAKERITTYATNARRKLNKSDGSIVYNP